MVLRNNCTKHYFLYVTANLIVIWGKNKIFDWNVIEQSVFWKLIIVLCQGQPLLLFSILVLLLSQRNHLSKSAVKSLNFRYSVYQIKNSIKNGSSIFYLFIEWKWMFKIEKRFFKNTKLYLYEIVNYFMEYPAVKYLTSGKSVKNLNIFMPLGQQQSEKFVK